MAVWADVAIVAPGSWRWLDAAGLAVLARGGWTLVIATTAALGALLLAPVRTPAASSPGS